MAEIKVLKGQETQVGPIGIVQMGSSGVRAGQRLQQAGQRLFDVAFKVAYDNEKQKGQEEAGLAAISARDPNTGKLTFPEIPKSLSPVAQKYYEPIANKRYQDALLIDINENAKRIASQTERNPTEFAKQFQTYLDTTTQNAGKFAGFVESTGAITSKQYQTQLFIDEVNFQDKLAAQNAVNNFYQKVSDIEEMSRKGAVGMARAMLGNSIEELNAFMAEHGDRVGQAFLPEMSKKLRAGFVGGDLVSIRNKLADVFSSQDPYSTAPALSIALNYMAIAIENKSLDNIPEVYKKELEKAGLKQSYLDDETFSGLHTEMARQTRVAQGTVQEVGNQTKGQLLTAAAAMTVADGGDVTAEQGDLIMNAAGLRTSVDLKNNLAQVLIRPEDPIAAQIWDSKFGLIHQLIFRTESKLPNALKSYLDDVMNLNAEQLPVAIEVYRQATRYNRGNRMFVTNRGLKDTTVTAFETLIAARDIMGDERLPEFMDGFRKLDQASKSEKEANINSKLEEDEGSNLERNIRKFVTSKIRKDASQDEIAFYTKFAKPLLFSTDAETATRILEAAGDAVFKTSILLHKTIGRSRFTPERAYPNPKDMEIFMKGVDKKLALIDSDLVGKLGKDVFLVPDTREGSALPVYTFVDRDKNVLRINGKPATVGNQFVVQELAKKYGMTIERLRLEARASRDAFLQLEQSFRRGADFSGAFTNNRRTLEEALEERDKRDAALEEIN